MTHEQFLLILFVTSVASIILLTAKLKVNAFFVLVLVGLAIGVIAGLPTDKVIQSLKEGLGNTLASIGLVIVFGTTLGIMLEKTGAAYSMADFILKKVGKHNAPIAMTITGYIFGIPIFCDSGFVVLSSLNKSLAVRAKRSMTVMGSLLGVSLYSVHCLIPPHPGATAAAGIIGASIGKLMLVGLAIALISLTATFFWIKFIGRNYESVYNSTKENISVNNFDSLPKPALSFLPVFLPIILIAVKSILMMYQSTNEDSLLSTIIIFIGDPSIALLIGLVFSFFINPGIKYSLIKEVIEEAIKAAGVILLITGAGGAFGSVLKTTGIGSVIGEYLSYSGLGIFIPFLIAAGLKTAQGSSTVAIITAASIILPMLGELQLASETGFILSVLSMGAGSMVFSHTNDSYFWVVTKFSGIEVKNSLKIFSTSTAFMGIIAQLIIFLLWSII